MKTIRPFKIIALAASLCLLAQAEEKLPEIGTFNTACELYRAKDFQGSENLFGQVAAQTDDEG
jgi:hypothetical protein